MKLLFLNTTVYCNMILHQAKLQTHTCILDIWRSKELTLEVNDLERVSESSLVFHGVRFLFWLPMLPHHL